MQASEFINSAPMVLAWADILQALAVRVAERAAQTAARDPQNFNHSYSVDDRVSFGRDVYEDVVEKMLIGPPDADIDIIQYLASSAVDRGQVFQTLTDLGLRLGGTSNSYFSAIVGARMRLVILDLIRSSSSIGYIPEVVEATLAALSGGRNYWDILDSKQLHEDNNPLTKFLIDTDLVELLIASAKHRYPYESALLRMTRALATCYDEHGPSIVPHISTIDTFTGTLPDSFSGYTTTQEEENNNSISLTAPLPLFEDRAAMRDSSLAMQLIDPDFIIPSDTYGRMLVEANPKVAYWFHQYPGVRYFGKVRKGFQSFK
jgi:nuclear pore complex protein Nup188